MLPAYTVRMVYVGNMPTLRPVRSVAGLQFSPWVKVRGVTVQTPGEFVDWYAPAPILISAPPVTFQQPRRALQSGRQPRPHTETRLNLRTALSINRKERKERIERNL